MVSWIFEGKVKKVYSRWRNFVVTVKSLVLVRILALLTLVTTAKQFFEMEVDVQEKKL